MVFTSAAGFLCAQCLKGADGAQQICSKQSGQRCMIGGSMTTILKKLETSLTLHLSNPASVAAENLEVTAFSTQYGAH